MLTILGTSTVLNEDNKDLDTVTVLPAGYYLEVEDNAGNPYTLGIPKNLYETVNGLAKTIADTTTVADKLSA